MNWQDEQHVALLRKAYARDLDMLTIRQDAALQRYIRDVFAAGYVEGEKARRAAPAQCSPRVDSPRIRAIDLATQILAALSTVAGMKIGSTTLHGAEILLVSSCAWLCVSWRHRLWVMGALNGSLAVVALINLWSALP